MENSQVEPTPIRLSLWDLFVWTTLAALACTLWTIHNAAAGSFQVNAQQVIFFLTAAFAFATTGSALFLFARRWYRGMPTDFQPGHWLLCLTGTIMIYHGLAILGRSTIMRIAMITSRSYTDVYLNIGQDVGFLLVCLLTGFLLPVRPTWRWVMLMPCLMSLTWIAVWSMVIGLDYYAFWYVVRIEIVLVVLGLFILLSIAVWDQATTRDRRDWLHWLGVATLVILNSPPILIRVYEALFR
ncbi:hypothetical protein [Blastopirellula marina]|uniref:Uncharacterized protein n=1 Tax=Blastopirellula marina TaxID=124 RepID=A0A2S8GPE6_9BACT|nr:hypothetical protein [Blastopirellula marina]PQO46316.1 hypothetical protein C5Y93_10045 [Blastopirellula marina]